MQQLMRRCLDRTPIIGLLMAALLFRALIPSGFMPTAGENGTLVMQLCSGVGSTSVVVDLDDDGSAAPSMPHLVEHSPCGFAANAHAAAPPATVFSSPALSADPHALAGPAASRVSPSIARTQSPRGPPLV